MSTDPSRVVGERSGGASGLSGDAFNHRDNDALYGDDAIHSQAHSRSHAHTHAHAHPNHNATPATSTTSSHAVEGNDVYPRMGALGLELGYLSPEQRPTHLPTDIFEQFDPHIEEDTEAAEALRANANIKVGKVSKIARSVNMQAVPRFVKKVTGRGKSGTARGKPPRIPPGQIATQDPDSEMYIVEEEAEDDDGSADEGDGSLEGNVHIGINNVNSNNNSSHNNNLHAEYDVPSAVMPPPDEPLPQDDLVTPVSTANNRKVAPAAATTDVHQPQQHSQPHQATQSLKPPPIGSAAAVAPAEDDDRGHKRHPQQSDDAKDIPADVYNATMEAGRKFLGAVDPHNLLTLQRWRRKKKNGEKKDRKSYVKGKVIDGKHELYALSIAVMLGVRTSIAKTNSAITAADGRRTLTPQDFMMEEKYEFAPKGSPTTPPHKLKHTFKFKDYAPMAFAYVRRMFGVNEFDFLLSVCGNANFIEFISNAKSGQFFFYSSDGKYMIKTMTNAESKFLRRILPHYFQHCTKNPNTLLPKFYGMYRVKLYHLRRNVKFVIMNSVYYTDKYLQTFYDLKGSVLGREAKPGQDVLKDNDLRAKLPQESLAMHADARKRLRDQISSDSKFLQRMQIMDYSLLVGIHHIPPKHNVAPGSIAKTGFRIRKPQNRRNSRNADQSLAGGSGSGIHHRSGEHPDDSSNASSHVSDLKAEQLKSDSKLADAQSDSTKKLILDFRDSTMSPSTVRDTIGGMLDEEDDNSYLDGAEQGNPTGYHSDENFDDMEFKKEHTIEQIFWPFHRLFDINGHRRMAPKSCYRCSNSPCTCEGHGQLLKAWQIPEFVAPLSNRKDGGFMMDTTGLEKPMHFKTPNGIRPYTGKIFYMGIIDILQQYNVRKRVETSYRKVEGFEEPSCVRPDDYADRFVRFFDEFSQPCVPLSGGGAEGGENTAIELQASGKRSVHVSVQSKTGMHAAASKRSN